jgi:hypothetical protein
MDDNSFIKNMFLNFYNKLINFNKKFYDITNILFLYLNLFLIFIFDFYNKFLIYMSKIINSFYLEIDYNCQDVEYIDNNLIDEIKDQSKIISSPNLINILNNILEKLLYNDKINFENNINDNIFNSALNTSLYIVKNYISNYKKYKNYNSDTNNSNMEIYTESDYNNINNSYDLDKEINSDTESCESEILSNTSLTLNSISKLENHNIQNIIKKKLYNDEFINILQQGQF